MQHLQTFKASNKSSKFPENMIKKVATFENILPFI